MSDAAIHSVTRSLRVAVVTAHLGMAGAEKQAFYMARALAEAGAEVRVCNLAGEGEYQDQLGRLGIECMCFGRLPGFPLRMLRLLADLRRFHPHVIQSVHGYTNVYSAVAGRILGALSIGGLRSDLVSFLRDNGAFPRLLLTWPDAIAANSKKSLADLQRAGLLEAGRLHLLPNVIDFDELPENGEALAGAEYRCVFVGRLQPLKRVDIFLRALAHARMSNPKLEGIVAGYGPEEARLKQLASELGLGGAVQFLGFRTDIPAVLRQGSMFVFCSESEGMPNVILEAMAAGVPVITTAAGDAADLVNAGGAGYVVGFGDVEATADAILRLAESPHLRKKLGRAGRTYVARELSTADLAARLTRLYAAVARASTRRYRSGLLDCLLRCPEL